MRRGSGRGSALGLLLAVFATRAPAFADAAKEGAAVEPGLEKITLAEAVRRALARNASVAISRAEIERAEALVKEARSGWMPTLTANGLFSRLDADRVFMDRVVAAANQWSGNLHLNVPLIAAPAWSETRRAKNARRVAVANAAETDRQVAAATARAFITVVAQHRLVAAAESARATAKEHYEYAHTRLLGGIGRSIDEVRAQQELASTEVQFQATLAALARTREAIGLLLAAPGPIDAVDSVELPAAPSLALALQDARSHRPDVRAVETRLAGAERAAGDVWAYYMPYLSAVAQPFAQDPPTLLVPTFGWQAQLVLALPLYDGGMRSGIARERDAVVAQARANVDATLRQAQAEVRFSFEAMMRSDLALAAARDGARLAKRARELADIAYRAGSTTNLEVIDASRRERDANIAATQAEDAARQSRLDLLVASGRFP